MKSAAIFLRPSTSQSPNASALYGTQFIPASLVMELAALLQAGQFDPKHTDANTGEPRFALAVSLWREDGSKGYVLSGRLDSPSERAAYEASKAQQGLTAPAQGQWGQPQAAPPQQQWAQPAQPQAAPPQQQWAQPQQAPPQQAPQQWAQPVQPQPAPAPQPSAWGGGGGWGS